MEFEHAFLRHRYHADFFKLALFRVLDKFTTKDQLRQLACALTNTTWSHPLLDKEDIAISMRQVGAIVWHVEHQRYQAPKDDEFYHMDWYAPTHYGSVTKYVLGVMQELGFTLNYSEGVVEELPDQEPIYSPSSPGYSPESPQYSPASPHYSEDE